jgi:hypothetical protein
VEPKKAYIYVKQSPKGLLYLGKTVQDPYKYEGSGLRWKRHLNLHGIKNANLQTWILHETYNHSELKELGIYYSNLFNVVKSDSWANMKEEMGDGGFGSKESHPWFGRKKTLDHRKKLSLSLKGNKSNKGKSHSEKTKKKQSESQKGKKKRDTECPHCGKIGNENVMHRWHFDKCPIYTGVKNTQSESFKEKMTGVNHPFFGKKRPEHSEFMKLNNPRKKV